MKANDPDLRIDMRDAIALFGLKVICILCGKTLRHRPEEEGRLRRRACPKCGWRSLRSAYWVKSHRHRAWELRQAHRNGTQKFTRVLN